jgi:predicted acylesterase/phospholipase RssA
MATKPQRDGVSLGIALSGGGHRAALFAAGALLGVVDAGEQAHTLSITSVSGGSLTNGLVAADGDFRTYDRAKFEEVLKPGLRAYAYDGLFFPGPRTDRYVSAVFFLFGLFLATVVSAIVGLAALGRGWELLPTGVAAGVAALVVVLVGAWRLAIPWTFRRVLLLGLALAAGLVPLAVLGTRSRSGWSGLAAGVVVIAVVLLVGQLTVRVFGWRSAKVDDALADGLLGPAPIATLDRPVHHVFCPTDLQSADHCYFSARLVYGYEMGCSTPAAGLKLSTAVQASACFPGGFVPRKLAAASVASGPLNQATVVLTDGGVYDNMADQWEFGWDNRWDTFASRDLDLTDYQAVPASRLVVVNAGGSFKDRPLKGKALSFEIAALLRDKDVMYSVSTSLRRRYLVDIFERANAPTDLAGALVHIAQLPTDVPERQLRSSDAERRARAELAIAFLKRLSLLDANDWTEVRDRSVATKTVLSALGERASTDLLHHAYVLTRVNMFVLLASGELPLPAVADAVVLQEWGRTRFQQLVQDSRT